MKKFNISAIVLAIGLAFSAGAMAEAISKQEYKSIDNNIDADFKAAKAQCDSLAGNAKDICEADAKGRRNSARAELEYKYKPTVKTLYEARIAKADAEYAVANEKCDDKAGNDKDVCVKEAKAARIHAEADAKAKMTTARAGAAADENRSKPIQRRSKRQPMRTRLQLPT